MTTQELIKQYRISLKLDEHGHTTGNLVVYRADKAALAAIKDTKPEIVAALLAERDAGIRAEHARQAKIDAIPGLREIESTLDDLASWQQEFSASFEGEGGGGVGVRPKPEHDMAALYAKYPRAKAYLDAQEFAASENDAKSAAGQKALEAIINGEDYERAVSTMDAEWKAHVADHLWD